VTTTVTTEAVRPLRESGTRAELSRRRGARVSNSRAVAGRRRNRAKTRVFPVRPWECPLCGALGQGLKTFEHVIPEAVVRAMRPEAAPTFVVEGDEVTRTNPYVRVYVCRACQQWLNVTFEQTTQGLIIALTRGEAVELSTDDQARVAAYFTKVVLLMNLWKPGGHDPALTSADLRAFRETAASLPGSQIWLGSMTSPGDEDGTDDTTEWAVAGMFPHPDEPREVLPAGSTSRAFSWDRLVVHYVRVPPSADAGKPVLNRAETVGILRPIWPVGSETLRWPTEIVMDLPTFVAVNAQFHSSLRRTWIG
jgi:hypothetical protein